MNHNDDLDCGLDGKFDDPVTIGRFNRWIAFALRHHVVPLKEQVQAIIKFHDEEREMHAKILGGITVLKWMLPVLLVLVNAMVIWVFYLLHKAGLL